MKSCIGCLIIILLITVISAGGFLLYMYKGCTYTVDKVVGKEVLEFDSGKRYVIHGNNDDMLVASDIFLQSIPPQDIIDKLEVGKTYKFRTCGLRIPLINYYKVIVNYQNI